MTQWSEMAKEQWDQFSADWHKRSEAMWETGSRRTILPLFTRYVHAENGPVLDAGCGDGYASCKLAASGYTVEGVDIAGEMIRLAKDRANDRAKNGEIAVRFQTGDVSSLPFSDQTFSGILCINVTEFTPSPLAALLEFHRLLKPGGILLLGILGPTAGPRGHSYRRLYGEATIQNTMMPWEAKQLASENGYVLLEEEPVYKEGVPAELANGLPAELREALSFLTLFVLKKG
ncbi:class I SAM-dependent methyltransferase [Brevibacillus borstelensis]|uniref:class I SAM-dependent methyltransferase n=1 Tax=Brevibacillus borstelensis TaxID=45462 RepID=UPI00287FE52B|nr:class I SAM-dependent methyltransferase [Brevibacillus borstelensis]WNF07085.1 class I SAM-dependent methyltransferase [Brevibacillus borstelensis]